MERGEVVLAGKAPSWSKATFGATLPFDGCVLTGRPRMLQAALHWLPTDGGVAASSGFAQRRGGRDRARRPVPGRCARACAFPNRVRRAARSRAAQHGRRPDRRRPHRHRRDAGGRRRPTVTTAAAEKIYRARDGDAADRHGARARRRRALAWLPQPTILFDGSRLDRRTDVRLGGGCRPAGGRDADLRARGDGRGRASRRSAATPGGPPRRPLVFADSLRSKAPSRDRLDRPATLGWRTRRRHAALCGARCGGRSSEARALLEEASSSTGQAAGTACWSCAPMPTTAARCRRDLAPLSSRLSGRPLPRVWRC